MVLSYSIFCQRNIADHLYRIEKKFFIILRNPCPVDESDIAFVYSAVFQNDIACVALFDLLFECESENAEAFDK
jgi:hypothetical protein